MQSDAGNVDPQFVMFFNQLMLALLLLQSLHIDVESFAELCICAFKRFSEVEVDVLLRGQHVAAWFDYLTIVEVE